MKISEVLSSTSYDILKKLAALNVGHIDERSPSAQEGGFGGWEAAKLRFRQVMPSKLGCSFHYWGQVTR